jgi:anti-sigma factor RsiW
MTWMRCVEFIEVVTDWQEGALSDDLRAEVEEHLGLCPDCVDYVEQLRMSVRLLRGAPDEAPPERARAAALAAFRARRR